MSDTTEQLRTAADELGDACAAIQEAEFDVGWDAPEEAPAPQEIVAKINEQVGELQVTLQELAANVDVMEEVDEHD